jgi:predicted PurR-regulated permease PerM
MLANRALGQTLIFGLVFGLCAAVFFGFLQPVILGLLVAFVVYPPLRRFCGGSAFTRQAAALVATLLFAVFVLLPLGWIGYVVTKDGLQLAESLRQGGMGDTLQIVFDRWVGSLPVPREEVLARSRELIQNVAARVLAFAGRFAQELPGFLLSVVLFLLTLFYGLADGRTLGAFIETHLPFRPELVSRLSQRTEQIVRGAVLGTLISAAAQGFVIGLGYLVFGVPRAFLAGLATIFLSFIPLIGIAPTGLAAVFYLLAQEAPARAIGMGLVFVAATVVDNIIRPYVLKGSADIHPMAALLSALGGLALFGFVGIFLGPLVTALAIEFLEIFREERTQNGV